VNFSRRQFYWSIGALLVVLIALNAFVAYTTRNSVPRRLMARARQDPDAAALAIGNSLVAGGFSEPVFDRAMQLPQRQGSLNLALGYSTPVEQLLLLRYALRQRIRPRLIVYGFYDLQLSTRLMNLSATGPCCTISNPNMAGSFITCRCTIALNSR
jgi:hypothetical protein